MTGLGGDSFWLCWDARAARLTALQAAGGAAARATPELYRRARADADPGPGPSGGAHGARGPRRPLDRAHLQPGAARLDDALGRSPRGRDPARGRRHPRLALPVARHGGRGRTSWRPGTPAFAPFRATYLDGGAAPAPGRRLVQPALARTLERLAREGGRAFYEGASPPRSGGRARLIGSPLRAADLAAHRSRLAEPATVPYRGGRGGHGPAALPGAGCARGAGDARRDGRPRVRSQTRPTTSTSPSRRRSSPSATGTAGSPTRSMPRCRSGASSIRPISGTAAGASRWTARRRRRVASGDRARRHDRLRHGRRGRQLRVADPEHLSRVGLGRRRGRDGRGAPESRRGLHARGRPPERARAGEASLPHAHALHVPPRREAGRWSRGRWAGRGSPRRSSRSRRGSLDLGLDVQSAVEAPRWVYGRTWGAPTRALSIEGRFGDAVAADLARRGHDVRVLDAWSDTAGHAQALELRAGRAPRRRRRPARRRARARVLGSSSISSLRRTLMSQPVAPRSRPPGSRPSRPDPGRRSSCSTAA